ncbi:MAG TPA: FHA domain-containing protein [Polyangium sp.]|nr:FHA domain-containing protein [Polyangium sp.]
MGIFDRFTRGGRIKTAQAKELSGQLAEAVALYIEADSPNEAARVLLLRADAERSPEQRIAFCDLAARTATDETLRKDARGRKALISYDLVRSRPGTPLRSELARVARELEEAGLLEQAKEAYVLAGDAEAEVRMLTEMGAIEQLEERLKASNTESRKTRALEDARQRVADLDKTAERRAALEVARVVLVEENDDVLRDAVRSIQARLLTAPTARFEIEGQVVHCAFGDEVTVGRGDATIVAAMRAISRVHIAVRRDGSQIFVRDLDTRNGTMLAGARIHGPIPVSNGVRLELGGEVPCTIEPTSGFAQELAPNGVVINVASTRWIVPLGALVLGDWRIERATYGSDSFIVLRTPAGGSRPILGELELAGEVELGYGDELRATRGGPIVLRVASGPLNDATSGSAR